MGEQYGGLVGVSVGVWLISFRVGDFVVVNEVLDFVFEVGTVIGVMAFLLVELTVLAKVKVTRYGIW